MKYSELFQPKNLGKREAPNSFVSQPMEGNDGLEGGAVSPQAIKRYEKLAQGKWGIIVVEALSVTTTSLARVHQMILSEQNLIGFKKLVTRCKEINPETLILFQITHSGRKAPSSFSNPMALYSPKKEEQLLKTQEIEDIRKAFVKATLLAEEAGADGVDFKMCHGYFGCEMLRPGNIREDRWGGSFENRIQFLQGAISEIKNNLKNPDKFILGSRISVYEGIRGGCGTTGQNELIEDLEEMSTLLRVMESLGMDYVNISAGIPGTTSEITRPTPGSYYLYLHQMRYARWAKKQVSSLKVIGSAYSILKEDALSLGEENLSKGNVDFIGWGRQSFADPLFPQKVRTQIPVDYCIGCSGCSKLMVAQKNTGCIIYNEYYKRLWREKK